MEENITPLITNDVVVLGILALILGFVFYTAGSSNSFWKKFYGVVPSVLVCYFIPALLNTFNVINGSQSQLYSVASRVLLPACLILLTIGIDIAALRKLGSKSLIMFLAGTAGVMIGGPLAFFITGAAFPETLTFNGEETWRGFATISGSWIGGGANQVALLEVFGASKDLFSQMIAVDILIGNLWTGILLFAAQHRNKINRWLKADNRAIVELETRMEQVEVSRGIKSTGTRELILLLAVSLGLTGLAHLLSDGIVPFFTENFPGSAKYSLTNSFFWIVVLATTFGLILSFTRVRRMESIGASKMGSVFLYILVATIGMNMDLKAVLNNPKFFLTGLIWILTHVMIMFAVARMIRAPFFFVAVGSQANIGGAATAPIVAAAFNKYLAPVGVLMAVLGYAVGTYGGYLCGLLLQWVSGLLS